MERDRKRSRTADGVGGSGGGGERKKERETKGKEPVVVVPPTEDEVDEFFAILRRMREAVKYFEKGKDRSEPSREADGAKVSEKKTGAGAGGAILDLNTVPDDGE